MSDQYYQLYARFTNVTPLTAASPVYPSAFNHKFGLTWSYPSQTHRPIQYRHNIKAVRIYRYIGNKNECIDPYTIPDPPSESIPFEGNISNSRIIFSAEQVDASTVSCSAFSYDGTGYHIATNVVPGTTLLSNVTSYVDDLSSYYNTDRDLLISHDLDSGGYDDKKLLNEIYTTERPIVYQIATYIGDVEDLVPYVIAPYTTEDKIACYSSKTQVRHDVLNYEFDMMWSTQIDRAGNSGNSISRTAMDIDALYRLDQRDVHRRPIGRGGYAWVSCRGVGGKIFRFNLSNGIQCGIGENPDQDNWRYNEGAPAGFQAQNWGHGITVDINTGNCWSGACQGSIWRITNSYPSGLTTQILPGTNIGTSSLIVYRPTSWYSSPGGNYGAWEGFLNEVNYNDNGCMHRETGWRRFRAGGSAGTTDTPVTYQSGIYGAINNRTNKQWISFCIKEFVATSPIYFKDGGSITIDGCTEEQHIIIKSKAYPYPAISSSTCGDLQVVSDTTFCANNSSATVDSWSQYYDYYGSPGAVQWVNVSTNKLSSLQILTSPGWSYSDTWSDYNTRINLLSKPYCINLAPNGKVFTNNEQISSFDLSNNYNDDFTRYNLSRNGEGITADLYNFYPNTGSDIDDYYIIYNDQGSGNIYQKGIDESGFVTGTTSIADVGVSGDEYEVKAVEIDDTNNVIGLGSKRTKIYRMNTGTDFPVEGNCRYPNIALEDQAFSVTNTREIEWFLTRDHEVMDDTTSKLFDGSEQTAKKAWLSLVEFNRREADHDSNTGDADISIPDVDSRGWHPLNDTNTYKYGIRIKPTYYNIDDSSSTLITNPTNIINLIREWAKTYASQSFGAGLGYKQNRYGRLLHPNFGRSTPSTGWYAGSGNNIVSTGSIEEHNGYYRLEKTTDWGYVEAYNQFTAHKSYPVSESLYNYDLIHPSISLPKMYLKCTGDSTLGFIDDIPSCYVWPFYKDSGLTINTTISAYDNVPVDFTLYANPGSFIVRDWYFNTDDYDENKSQPIMPYYTHFTRINEAYNSNITTYLTSTDVEYTYNTPSMGGRIYLDNTFDNPYDTEHNALPRKTKLPLHRNGAFIATAWTSALDIYSNTSGIWTWCANKVTTFNYLNSCATYSPNLLSPPITAVPQLSASNNIEVYERWPEPRFYQNVNDSVINRQIYFNTPSYLLNDLRYDQANSFVRLSNATDAVRKDVLIGVEPLSAIIEDRSIARSFPISSWTFLVTSDNPLVSNYNLVVTHANTPGLNGAIDTKGAFEPLTAITFPYGTNNIALSVASLSAGTISDRVFSQCVNVKEMQPFAWYDILSVQTVSANYNETEDISSYYVDVTAVPNATVAYVSGYAPYLKVLFKDMSFPHTFPISSYHWDFGDIYNEGSSIYSPSSNYYTYSATNITAGSFAWVDRIPWSTNVSNLTASHTYTMPGRYTATLTVRASSTGTSDSYSKWLYPYDVHTYTCDVYVEEIMPNCGYLVGGFTPSTMSSDLTQISGQGPITAYFSLSEFIPGSFSPCQIKWKFDDHEEIISRYPATTATSQGLPVTVNHSNFASTVIPYIINPVNTAAGPVRISVSLVMCNTNTLMNCFSAVETGIIQPSYIKSLNYKLFKSRIDENGNLIYIFDDEGENNVSDTTTYTIMLTGEVKGL